MPAKITIKLASKRRRNQHARAPAHGKKPKVLPALSRLCTLHDQDIEGRHEKNFAKRPNHRRQADKQHSGPQRQHSKSASQQKTASQQLPSSPPSLPPVRKRNLQRHNEHRIECEL